MTLTRKQYLELCLIIEMIRDDGYKVYMYDDYQGPAMYGKNVCLGFCVDDASHFIFYLGFMLGTHGNKLNVLYKEFMDWIKLVKIFKKGYKYEYVYFPEIKVEK